MSPYPHAFPHVRLRVDTKKLSDDPWQDCIRECRKTAKWQARRLSPVKNFPGRRKSDSQKWKNKRRRNPNPVKAYFFKPCSLNLERALLEERPTRVMSDVEALLASIDENSKELFEKYSSSEELLTKIRRSRTRVWEAREGLGDIWRTYVSKLEEIEKTFDRKFGCCGLCYRDPWSQPKDQPKGKNLIIHSTDSGKGHLCPGCVKRSFERSFGSPGGEIEMKCPCKWRCKHTVPNHLLLAAGITEEQIEHRRRIMLDKTLAKMPGIRFCPSPSCGAPMFLEDEKTDCSNGQCPACKYTFCTDCNEPSHEGYTCDGLKTLKFHERWVVELDKVKAEETDLDGIMKSLRRLARDAKRLGDGRRCPGCRNFIWKTEGCDHMTCMFCNGEFHFCCGEAYNEDCICHQNKRTTENFDDTNARLHQSISNKIRELWPDLLPRLAKKHRVDFESLRSRPSEQVKDLALIAHKKNHDRRLGIKFAEIKLKTGSEWIPCEVSREDQEDSRREIGHYVRWMNGKTPCCKDLFEFSLVPPTEDGEHDSNYPVIRFLIPDIHFASVVSRRAFYRGHRETTVALPRYLKGQHLKNYFARRVGKLFPEHHIMWKGHTLHGSETIEFKGSRIHKAIVVSENETQRLIIHLTSCDTYFKSRGRNEQTIFKYHGFIKKDITKETTREEVWRDIERQSKAILPERRLLALSFHTDWHKTPSAGVLGLGDGRNMRYLDYPTLRPTDHHLKFASGRTMLNSKRHIVARFHAPGLVKISLATRGKPLEVSIDRGRKIADLARAARRKLAKLGKSKPGRMVAVRNVDGVAPPVFDGTRIRDLDEKVLKTGLRIVFAKPRQVDEDVLRLEEELDISHIDPTHPLAVRAEDRFFKSKDRHFKTATRGKASRQTVQRKLRKAPRNN